MEKLVISLPFHGSILGSSPCRNTRNMAVLDLIVERNPVKIVVIGANPIYRPKMQMYINWLDYHPVNVEVDGSSPFICAKN